jgi:hypothetical protein
MITTPRGRSMTTATTTATTSPAPTTPPAAPAAVGPAHRGTLMELIKGTFVSQTISVFAQLGVADALAAGPRTSDDLAAAIGADGPTLYRLLRALSDLEVVAEGPDRSFALAPLGQLLRTDVPGSMNGLATMVGLPYHRNSWTDLRESVRTGRPAFSRVHGTEIFEYLNDHPDEAAAFDTAMTGISTGMINGLLAGYDFSPYGTIIDVGGGHGALLLAVLAAHPASQGVLFDRPEVIAAGEAARRSAPAADRCRVIAGDFFVTVPEGGDCYLMSNIIHDWDDADSVAILTRIGNAMSPSARLVLVEPILPDGAEPSFAKMLDLEMLVMTPGGRHRTVSEFRALLDAAGLVLSDVAPATGGRRASFVEARRS